MSASHWGLLFTIYFDTLVFLSFASSALLLNPRPKVDGMQKKSMTMLKEKDISDEVNLKHFIL